MSIACFILKKYLLNVQVMRRLFKEECKLIVILYVNLVL
jgi:hypothetical protein